MSGGTWDYQDMRLHDLAKDVRSGPARWQSEDASELEFPRAREAMAELLEVAGNLLHELDWFLAGDTLIEDESAWMNEARLRLLRLRIMDHPVQRHIERLRELTHSDPTWKRDD